MRFGVFGALALLMTLYRYMDRIASGAPARFGGHALDEFTGVYGVMVLAPAVSWMARKLPLGRAWLHLPALLGFSLLHTTWNWAMRSALSPLLGMGPYDYGIQPYRYLMEFPIDVVLYALVVTITVLVDHYRRSREREVELARAQLANLRLQLQPHFLFNALNAISGVMYEDAAKADRMLGKLSDLLRATLEPAPAGDPTLAEEIRHLELYLDVMRARLEERLEVAVDVDPAASRMRVPSMLLQPLVENAIRYGATPGSGRVEIAIRGDLDDGMLRLAVEDRGPGLPASPRTGIGLGNTRQRLERLYGDRQRLEVAARPEGGLRVLMTLPAQPA